MAVGSLIFRLRFSKLCEHSAFSHLTCPFSGFSNPYNLEYAEYISQNYGMLEHTNLICGPRKVECPQTLKGRPETPWLQATDIYVL